MQPFQYLRKIAWFPSKFTNWILLLRYTTILKHPQYNEKYLLEKHTRKCIWIYDLGANLQLSMLMVTWYEWKSKKIFPHRTVHIIWSYQEQIVWITRSMEYSLAGVALSPCHMLGRTNSTFAFSSLAPSVLRRPERPREIITIVGPRFIRMTMRHLDPCQTISAKCHSNLQNRTEHTAPYPAVVSHYRNQPCIRRNDVSWPEHIFTTHMLVHKT